MPVFMIQEANGYVVGIYVTEAVAILRAKNYSDAKVKKLFINTNTLVEEEEVARAFGVTEQPQ